MASAKSDSTSKADQPPLAGVIRKLWSAEAPLFRDHLLRLDTASRRMRFGYGASSNYLETYAERMSEPGTLTYAYVEDGAVRAAAELKQLGGLWGHDAEAALSVEATHQNQGLGTKLLGRLIQSARYRGLQHLILNCLPENERMQAVAKKHDAGLSIAHGEVKGEITADGSAYFSFFEEAFENRVSLMFGLIDMQSRLSKSEGAKTSSLGPRR